MSIGWLLRRPLRLLLAAAVSWALLRALRPALPAGDGLVAEYYANTTWDGVPAQSGPTQAPSAASIRRYWRGAPPDRFSVRWTGFLTVFRSGLYHFATTSDDGSLLFIDDQLVVNNGGQHEIARQTGNVFLTLGSHRVLLDYVQFGGSSELSWSWALDGGRYSPVPSWVLSQRRPKDQVAFAARIVDVGLWGCAALIAFAAAWQLQVSLRGQGPAIGRWAAARGRDLIAFLYDYAPSQVVPAVVFVVILFVPWPGAGAQPFFFRSVEITVRDLDRAAREVLQGGFGAFQTNINTPRAGEQILPPRVQEVLTMLRGRALERYRLSDSLAGDPWTYQQIVASTWPSKLEPDAKARFMLNSEPIGPGCTLLDRQREVSLVHCP